MQGMIFNEFLNYVEQTYSYPMVDKIIIKSNLKSGGAYTSIGTYDAKELFSLLSALSEETKQPTNILLIEYGKKLFEILLKKYPNIVREKASVFQFLNEIEKHIHVEVKKLYIRADLPHFKSQKLSSDTIVMIYTSPRPLADLAEGLIRGCIQHYQENIIITREDIAVKKGYKAKFTLTKRS